MSETPRRFTVDLDAGAVRFDDGGAETVLPFADPRGFRIMADAWVRAGWDAKYVYGFSWLGRPVIQLPEDLLRIQELITELRPDVVVETGVAHGGSLVFYAGLLELLGHGQVVGVEIALRDANRAAIEEHSLAHRITLVDGSSTAPDVVDRVRELVGASERVLVLLDSNHSRDHVLDELRAYAPLLPVGSWMIAADGVMRAVVGGPRTEPDWDWNNPIAAADAFLEENDDFERVEPPMPFDETLTRVTPTYWDRGWLRRVR